MEAASASRVGTTVPNGQTKCSISSNVCQLTSRQQIPCLTYTKQRLLAAFNPGVFCWAPLANFVLPCWFFVPQERLLWCCQWCSDACW